MRSIISRSKMGRFTSVAMFGLMLLVWSAGSAFAQTATPTPPPPVSGIVDIDMMTATSKTEISSAVGKFIPFVVAVFASMLGAGLLFKWVKKGAKTS